MQLCHSQHATTLTPQATRTVILFHWSLHNNNIIMSIWSFSSMEKLPLYFQYDCVKSLHVCVCSN